ncbi:MAG: HAD family hydrolase [Pseudomonadota bacterium]|nr:HAD family hydrolase [Pseudomonadota bacterium]MEC7702035.1 HAD family hydrolase [Pseudomonadota bacterium]MEC9234640.1 HAD family hydrolase [Pseudomonadota bacterium]MED5422677.1 HAD family hydrolase [Pseudomonadota bacterium]
MKTLSAIDGVGLYIATNQGHDRAAYLMKDLGFGAYSKDILHSAAIGHRKPSPEYFVEVDKRLNRDPARKVIFYDDTQEIIDTANAHGWEAHKFDSVADLKKSAFLRPLI